MRICLGITLLLLLAAGGCVERTLSIQSEPAGALVVLNDVEVGRTPMTMTFKWYGPYDLILRKDGYKSEKTVATVIAPFYEWPPFDLVSELQPFTIKDVRKFNFDLKPDPVVPGDFGGLMVRANEMKKDLQSSQYTTSRPSKQPTTRPK